MTTMNSQRIPPHPTSKPGARLFTPPWMAWQQPRESAQNWLALGLLLAAWNAAGDANCRALRRPEALRGYSSVSVRAVQRSMMQQKFLSKGHKSVNQL